MIHLNGCFTNSQTFSVLSLSRVSDLWHASSAPETTQGQMHSVVLLLLVLIYSVTQSSPALCNPMDCIISCLLVLHHLLQFVHTQSHWSVMPSNNFVLYCPLLLLQTFPASECFPMSWLFTSDSHNIGASASASAPPVNFQDWFPLGLTGLISFQPKGLTRVFSKIAVQRYQFLIVQPPLWYNLHWDMTTEKKTKTKTKKTYLWLYVP